MKLTTCTNAVKNNALKMIAGAALAGALLTAAPAAQAQHFAVRFGVGVPVIVGPRYYAPAPPVVVYGRPGFYGPDYGYGWHRDFDHRDWDRRDFDRRDFDHRGFDGRR